MSWPSHDAAGDLALNNLANIKANTRAFVETLLGKQIAWEYLKNADAFNALTLEVWKGEETYYGRLTRITSKSSHGLLEHESKIAVSA